MFLRPNRNFRAKKLALQSRQDYLREATSSLNFSNELFQTAVAESDPEKKYALLLLSIKYYEKNRAIAGRDFSDQDNIQLALTYVQVLYLTDTLPDSCNPSAIYTDYMEKLSEFVAILPRDSRTANEYLQSETDPEKIYLRAIYFKLYAAHRYFLAAKEGDLERASELVASGHFYSKKSVALLEYLCKNTSHREASKSLEYVKNEMQLAQSKLQGMKEEKPAPAVTSFQRLRPLNVPLMAFESRRDFLRAYTVDFNFGLKLQERGREVGNPEMHYDLLLLAIQTHRKNLTVAVAEELATTKRLLAMAYCEMVALALKLPRSHNPSAIYADYLEKLRNILRDHPLDERSVTEQIGSAKNSDSLLLSSKHYQLHFFYQYFVGHQHLERGEQRQAIAALRLANEYCEDHLALEEYLQNEIFYRVPESSDLKGIRSDLNAVRFELQKTCALHIVLPVECNTPSPRSPSQH